MRWVPAGAGVLVVVLGTAISAQPRATPSAAQRAAEADIRRRREVSNVAIAAHDTAGLGSILAPGVVIVTAASSRIDGRDAMVAGFAERFRALPDIVYRRSPSDVVVFVGWRMASEHGRWTGSWTDTDGKIAMDGSYFAKWRNIAGTWLVESETYVPEHCTGGKYCATVP